MQGFHESVIFTPMRHTNTKELRIASRYVPPGSVKVAPKGVDVVFYIGERNSDLGKQYFGICYIGSAAKPAWHYRFKSEAQRENKIRDQISASKSTAEFRAKLKKERVAARDVKVGDIFCASWGYSMTIVDFWQVVELVGKSSVRVRRIAGDIVKGDGWSGQKKPVKDAFIVSRDDSEFTVRVSGKSCKIDGHHASVTDPNSSHYFNSLD